MEGHYHERCPNCGRANSEDEIYCYFCEFDLNKLKEKIKHHKN